MTSLFTIAQTHGFNEDTLKGYTSRLAKRQRDRKHKGLKRANADHSALLAYLDRQATLKAEALKLARENARRARGSVRPIPVCKLRSLRDESINEAQAYSWKVFGRPYGGK